MTVINSLNRTARGIEEERLAIAQRDNVILSRIIENENATVLKYIL